MSDIARRGGRSRRRGEEQASRQKRQRVKRLGTQRDQGAHGSAEATRGEQ